MNLVLAVVGDRHYKDYETFSKILIDELERFPATKLITGDASGVDQLARLYAVAHNIPITVYCASKSKSKELTRDGYLTIDCSDWATQGYAAGPIRNISIVDASNKILLFDGGGKGSRSVKSIAEKLGKEVERWEITL